MSVWDPRVSVPIIGTILIIVLSAVSQIITSPTAEFWITISTGILVVVGFLISIFLVSPESKSLTTFYTLVVAMIIYIGVVISSYTGTYLIQDTSPMFASISSILLGGFLLLIYLGTVLPARWYFYYIGFVGVIVIYTLYLATTGNAPPSTTEGFSGSNGGGGGDAGSAPAPSSSQFGGYTSLFQADAGASSPGPAQRSLVDATFLTVAYPTLGPADVPPVHNTDQVQGLHSLDNLRNTLSRGATALFFDIYYEDITPSSRFPKTWRVGTLNTITGVIQNKRTISLASALGEVQRMIQSASATKNPRTFVVFLNPRYTSDQMKRISKLEDALAKTIQDSIQSCKSIPYSATAGAPSTTEEDPLAAARLSQVQNQVVVVMGGPKEPSSTALRNVIQGVVNLSKVTLDNSSGNAGNPIYSLTYVPKSPQPTFTGNVLASNHGNASTSNLTAQNRSVQNKAIGLPQLVMMFPDSVSGKPLYPSNDLPHITYGASFPVVFPTTLTPAGYKVNIGLFNGFALAQNERLVRSAIYSNLAPIADPRSGGSLYCGGNASDVIDPKADTEWDKVMLPTVKRSTWCADSKTNVFPFDMRPVILYRPRELTVLDNKSSKNVVDLAGKTDVPGIIPKPTVVDYWFDGSRVGIYRLRAILMSQTVVGKSLD